MVSEDVERVTFQRRIFKYGLFYGFIVVAAMGVLGAIFSIVEYRSLTSYLDRTESFSDSEEYLSATNSLKRAEDSWLVKVFSIRRSSIEALTDEVESRIGDQQKFSTGSATGNEGDWGEGINLLSTIPTNSFYYQRAQTAIEQFRVKILGQELEIEQSDRQSAENEVERQILALNLLQDDLEIEQSNRQSAEDDVERQMLALNLLQDDLEIEQSNRPSAEDEVERQILALNILQDDLESETASRLLAESATESALKTADEEQLAKEASQKEAQFQTERANREESAKLQAQSNTLAEQQRAYREELAKLQAQSEATAQEQRADLEEKARIQELALTNPMIQGIVSGELKYYFEPLPMYTGLDVFIGVDDISVSLSSWNPYGVTIRRVFNPNDANLTVSWLKDYGPHTIGESIFKAYIKVGIGTENCQGDWRAFDSSTVKKVLWHEIGHSMGYGHSSNPNNVMYWQTETSFDVEQEIADIVPAGWYFTYPLCSSGNYGYSFESDDNFNGFDLFVLPPGTDASTISTGEGLVYTGCGKANMVRYTDTCDVPANAVIYIANNGLYDAVRLDGEITLLDKPPWPTMDWDQAAYEYDDAQLNAYSNLFH